MTEGRAEDCIHEEVKARLTRGTVRQNFKRAEDCRHNEIEASLIQLERITNNLKIAKMKKLRLV